MRTSEYGEICISIDYWKMVARVFISNGKKGEESKIAERQRERECVCVCECWSKPTTASINIHNSIRERKHICGNKLLLAFVIN
jgi:hypothetical protein